MNHISGHSRFTFNSAEKKCFLSCLGFLAAVPHLATGRKPCLPSILPVRNPAFAIHLWLSAASTWQQAKKWKSATPTGLEGKIKRLPLVHVSCSVQHRDSYTPSLPLRCLHSFPLHSFASSLRLPLLSLRPSSALSSFSLSLPHVLWLSADLSTCQPAPRTRPCVFLPPPFPPSSPLLSFLTLSSLCGTKRRAHTRALSLSSEATARGRKSAGELAPSSRVHPRPVAVRRPHALSAPCQKHSHTRAGVRMFQRGRAGTKRTVST